MEPNKVDATNMSLDDYIATYKISKSEKTNKHNNFGERNTYTKFNRRRDTVDEDEEMESMDDGLVLIDEPNSLPNNISTNQNDDKIWHGPDSSISYIDCFNKNNDLRHKLGNNRCSHVTSVQDRLKVFNNGSSCLISVTQPNANQTNGNGKNNMWRGRRNRGNYGNHFNNNGRYNNQNRNAFHCVNNGRVYRKHVQTNFSPFANCIVHDNFRQPLRNVIIEQPTTSTAVNQNNTNTSQLSATANNIHVEKLSLKDVIGVDDKNGTDSLVEFAKRLMEMAKNATDSMIHKPVYDMKTQKEIHLMQNKQLFYKSPGRAVVSSDGTGIDCNIKPHSSGLTLNCRFT